MANPEANPLFSSDCRSFEYAKPPGASQRGCAVEDFDHTFYTAGVNSSGAPYYGEVDVNIDTIYFTMPNWMTNGQAANATAMAVTSAVQATNLYFFENPYVTAYSVSSFFEEALISELALVGGTMSTRIEPFPIPNPATYIQTLIGWADPFDC